MCKVPSFEPVALLIPMLTLASKLPYKVYPLPFMKVALIGGW
jgi:hypothetical protein